MRTYSRILATPGVAALFLAQLTARFAIGIWPVGILLHVEGWSASYAVAGLVVGLMTFGRALATPLLSRLVGRWGAAVVVGCAGGGSALAALGLVLADLLPTQPAVTIAISCVLGCLAGASMPPVQPVVRGIYPELVPPHHLARMFSLDAAAQEIIFVIGPLLAFAAASAFGSRAALLAGVLATIVGTAWLVAQPALRRPRSVSSSAGMGRVLLRRTVLVGTLTSLLLVAANSAVEAGVVGAFGEHGLTGGLLLAVYSLASLAGGLGFAHLTVGRRAAAAWMLLVAVGLSLGALWIAPGWLAVALVLAGLGVAPVFAAIASTVTARVPAGEATEAFGWVDTGAILGASAGFGLAGMLLDGGGPAAAFWLAAGLALAGSALAAAGTAGPARSRRTAGRTP
ncbi:MAG: MFS transporter [Propionicimonas sp.]|nr:MFS transporter [Propionicimonas sp.]